MGKPLKNSDLIFLGAEKATDLTRHARAYSFSGNHRWAYGLSTPRGIKEINELQAIYVGRQAGMVDVKAWLLGDDTALKFVRPRAKRYAVTLAKVEMRPLRWRPRLHPKTWSAGHFQSARQADVIRYERALNVVPSRDIA